MACQKGHYDVVQTLLGAGADVNIARSDVSDVTCTCTPMNCAHTDSTNHSGIF